MTPFDRPLTLRAGSLCHAAGITRDRFGTLRRRDQLPFDDPLDAGGGEAAERAWGRYNLEAAVRLRLAVDLADHSGLSPGDAANMVRNAYGLLPDVFREPATLDALAAAGSPGPAGDVWVARAVSRFSGEDGTVSYAAAHVAGALATIIVDSTARAARDRAAFGEELVRLDMVSASAAARFAHHRLAGALPADQED